MMHTTCLNSAVSIRCRDSRSSFFDDSTYLINTRFETNPVLISSSSSNCCCCCCCCGNGNNSIYNSLPRINPSFLYNGLRQSTLIQFSPSKRLIYHGKRRQSCNYTSGSRFSSLTDSDRNYYYEKLYSMNEKRKLGKGRYACLAFEDKKNDKRFSNEISDEFVDNVEILLDLLTEEVDSETINVRNRKRIERKDCYVADKSKIVSSSNVKRDSKRDNKVAEIRSRDEENRRIINERRVERENYVRGVSHERKKEGSSCSSYYSISSKDEFESDNDVEIENNNTFVKGESSSTYKDDRESNSYIKGYNEEVEKKDEISKINTAETYYGNQEWRKKSEKKLNVDSSQQQSHVSVNFDRNSQQYSQTQNIDRITDQSQSKIKQSSQQYSQTQDIDRITDLSQTKRNQNSQQRITETSETDNKLNTSVQELRLEASDRVNRQNEYKRHSNVISEASGSHKTDTRVSSSSSSLLEARMKNSEEKSTQVSGQVKDRREERHQIIDNMTTLQASRVKSQQISEISDTRITNTENTSVSRRQSETRSEKQEKVNTSQLVDLRSSSSETELIESQVKDRREEKHQLIESRVNSQQTSEISNTENTSISLRQSDIRNEKQELHLETSSSGEKVNTSQQIDLRRKNFEDKYPSSEVALVVGPTASTKTGRKTTKASSFNVGMQKEASSSYKALKLNPERKSQETSSSIPIITDSQEILREDTIDSANKQQKSSSHFVGEFIKNAKNELTKTDESELVYEDAEQHELVSSGSGSGSGNSDKKSGITGPSDEMWHVTGSTAQQPDNNLVGPTESDDNLVGPTESDNNITGPTESDKRSGRSLWNVIGDVVRLRWGSPRAENTPKSNQSTTSETWFSGHEQEDSNDENLKTGSSKSRSRSKKEELDSPYLSSSSNTNQGSLSTRMSPNIIEESSAPLPVIRMRRSPPVVIASEPDASDRGKMVKTEQPVSPLDASGRDKMVKTEQPVSPVDASGRGKMVKTEQLASPSRGKMVKTEEQVSPVDESGRGKTVIVDQSKELKRRKLARIDQVTKDRFDEWEEAYTVEAKQREYDEYFMKEALLEAKKAADFWEVPVGAVLVQDGKVIARGYNLVEELRDSTAHAEMICIREASNNLRSWRLSGTTLYVTLEPCPMCAGAILQARIDTVVWGAPNKLLGADGSWIRLFPDGEGGNGSSVDKPPPPVHPFHPNMVVRRGVLSSECAEVMQQFFQLRRKKKENRTEGETTTSLPPSSSSSLPITHHHRSKFFSKMHDAFSIMFCL